jgi:hypothetical protein
MPPSNRSTKIILPASTPVAASSSNQAQPAPRMRALPTTHEDKKLARARFGEAHRAVAAQVAITAAAIDNKAQRAAVRELSDALVSRVSFILVALSLADALGYRSCLAKP